MNVNLCKNETYDIMTVWFLLTNRISPQTVIYPAHNKVEQCGKVCFLLTVFQSIYFGELILCPV